MLPRHAGCLLSRFRCNGHSLLLGSYLSRIGRIENPSSSACGHLSRDGQFRISNLKDLNPKLSESNRIRLISCLQALSRCLFTDFLFVKVLIACNNSKTNSLTQTLIEGVRFLMMHTRADII